MLAVVIKGNPKFINNDTAKNYYKEIHDFLIDLGFTVNWDAGADYTRPRQDADLYIGHSRGVGRYEFMEVKNKSKFLKFGDPDGIIDPVDAKWQHDNPPPTNAHPPKEHFTFSDDQKRAILHKCQELHLHVSNESKSGETEDEAKHRLYTLAYSDPFLGGESLKPGIKGMQLITLPSGEHVGFVMPMAGTAGYSRVGSIYIEPKYRGKGIAGKFVAEYFKDKPGQAWIRPTNKPSQGTFYSAGFYKSGRTTNANGKLYEEWVNKPRMLGW